MVDVGEGRLTYALDPADWDETKAGYLNLVKDLSWLNSKGMEHTTRDGHVLGYLVDIVVLDATDNEYAFIGAPNSWKMRNSFRKFHFHRHEMFRDAGITGDEIGKYGHTIRPYLEPNMVDVTVDAGSPTIYEEFNVLSPLQATDTNREWTYSSLASNPGWSDHQSIGDIVDDATSRKIALADEWKLTILGENNVDVETTGAKIQSYLTAGMIHSYNLDRMEVVTPRSDEVVSGPNNPLAALKFQGAAVGEVVDIAEEQEMERPPYDLVDSGDSIDGIVFDYTTTNSATLKVNYVRNVFVPAGILAFGCSETPTDEAIMTVHVKAIVECRDWV